MNGWLYNEEEYLAAEKVVIVSDTATISESISIRINPLMVSSVEVSSIVENINLVSSVASINVSETLSQSEFVQFQFVFFVMIDVSDSISTTEFTYFAFFPSIVKSVSDTVTKSESITIRSSAIIYIEVSDTDSIADVVDGVWTSFVLSWNDIETYLSTLPLSWTVISDALEGTRAAILSLSWRVMDVLSSLLMSWRVIPIQVTGLNSNIQLPVFFVSFNALQVFAGENEVGVDSVTLSGLSKAITINEVNVEIDVVVISIPRMINVTDSQLLTEAVVLKQPLVVGDTGIYNESISILIV